MNPTFSEFMEETGDDSLSNLFSEFVTGTALRKRMEETGDDSLSNLLASINGNLWELKKLN